MIIHKNGKKKIFFLAGLPRAGNTLLSSILNQNPNIAVTANSVTIYMLLTVSEIKDTGAFKNFPDHQSFNNVTQRLFDLYYKDWKQTYIIDRGYWGTRTNLKILKETQKEIKIIVLTRDIIEVLASFIRRFFPDNFDYKLNSKMVEEQCHILIRQSVVLKNLEAIKHLLLTKNRSLHHLVKYNTLVEFPERTIKEIYDYLEIPHFKHRYINLDQFELNKIKYDDTVLGFKKPLHSIKTDRIEKSDYDAYSIIPQAIVEEYKKDWLL